MAIKVTPFFYTIGATQPKAAVLEKHVTVVQGR